MGSKPTGISGSRSAAVLGISKYNTRLEIWLQIKEEMEPGWCQKNGYTLPDFVDIDPWDEDSPDYKKYASMRFGLAIETAMCDYGKLTQREKFYQLKITDASKVLATCHIDGILDKFDLGTAKGETCIVENKTTHLMAYMAGWGEPGTDRVPDSYYIQAQHQMLCSNYDNVVIQVAIFPKPPADMESAGFKVFEDGQYDVKKDGKRFCSSLLNSIKDLDMLKYYEIDRNQEFIDLMMEKYKIFAESLDVGKPPEINDSEDLRWLFPGHVGEVVADDRIVDLWAELSDIENEMKSQKDRVVQIKNEIAGFISEKTPDVHYKDKIRLIHPIGGHSMASHNGKSLRVNRRKDD